MVVLGSDNTGNICYRCILFIIAVVGYFLMPKRRFLMVLFRSLIIILILLVLSCASPTQEDWTQHCKDLLPCDAYNVVSLGGDWYLFDIDINDEAKHFLLRLGRDLTFTQIQYSSLIGVSLGATCHGMEKRDRH